eukprot:300045-Rhodomonas_salina.1
MCCDVTSMRCDVTAMCCDVTSMCCDVTAMRCDVTSMRCDVTQTNKHLLSITMAFSAVQCLVLLLVLLRDHPRSITDMPVQTRRYLLHRLPVLTENRTRYLLRHFPVLTR